MNNFLNIKKMKKLEIVLISRSKEFLIVSLVFVLCEIGKDLG